LYNRVASLDGRRVASIYGAQAQYAQASHLTPTSGSVSAPLWNAVLSRNGKAFKFRYAFDAVDERFRTQSGFIGRGGIAQGLLDQWYTYYLKPGRFLETIVYDPTFMYTWTYGALVHQGDAIEKKLHNRIAVTARGGWSAVATVMAETFGFDRAVRTLSRAARTERHCRLIATAIFNRDSPSRSTRRRKYLSFSAYYIGEATRTPRVGARGHHLRQLRCGSAPADRLRITRATSSSASSVGQDPLVADAAFRG
jgi:hypothetical protein